MLSPHQPQHTSRSLHLEIQGWISSRSQISSLQVGLGLEQYLPKSVLRDVNGCYAKKGLWSVGLRSRGLLQAFNMWIILLIFVEILLVFPKPVWPWNMFFFCFFFCYSFLVGANNRTNVCETLHSLEASGGATTDWVGTVTKMRFSQSVKQCWLVGVLCSFLWQKLWTIPEMYRDCYLPNTSPVAGGVEGVTALRGCYHQSQLADEEMRPRKVKVRVLQL